MSKLLKPSKKDNLKTLAFFFNCLVSNLSSFRDGNQLVLIVNRKIPFLFGIFFFIFSSFLNVWAATYYVDATNGNDNNSGLNLTTAWKTIAKVNASNFFPGDNILFKRGEIWREQIMVPSSGSAIQHITFGAYGLGEQPVFNGADLLTEWTKTTKTNIWQTKLTNEPNQVFFDGIRGTRQTGRGPDILNMPKEWYWASDVLYVYSTSDPNTSFTSPGIESSIRTICFDNNGKNYITVNNISVSMSNSNGFRHRDASNITYDNISGSYNWDVGLIFYSTDDSYDTDVTVLNSTFSYNGNNGVYTGSYLNNVVFQDCTFDHNGQNPDDIYNSGVYIGDDTGRTSYGIVIEDCISHSNGKDSENNVVAGPNGGFGIWMDTVGSNSGSDPVVFRYNKVYNNSNSGIHLENTDYPEAYYNLSYYNDTEGIRLQCSDKNYPQEYAKVYNNISFSNDVGIYVHGKQGEAVIDNINYNEIKNNISFGNSSRNLRAIEGGQNVSDENGRGTGNIYANNCFGDERRNFIEWGTGIYYSTYKDWETSSGSTTKSVEADPLMINPENGDFTPQRGSPCIDAGTNVGLTHDFIGTLIPQGGGIDVGAFEYKSIAAPKKFRILPSQ